MKIKQSNEMREFNCMYKEIDEMYHEVSLNAGLSDSSFLILYALFELGDGCLQIDIANRYWISKQTISSSVRSLEKKGFLYLEKGNGRDMHLHLTSEGRLIAEKHVLPLMEVENNVFAAMSPEERRELLRLTRVYTDIFKEKVSELL